MSATPAKLYYSFDAWGLLDLRCFGCVRYSIKDALKEAKAIEKKDAEITDKILDGAKVGDWYCIHAFGGYAYGPHKTKKKAEAARRKNILDEQSFCCDVGYDPGFVGKVVKVLDSTVIAERKTKEIA